MDLNVYPERIKKVREGMTKNGIDVFLVSPSSNLFYLSGFAAGRDERLFLLILPREKEPFILANLLYREQIKSISVGDQIFWKDGDDPYKLLAAEIKKRNIRINKIALEPRIPALFSLPLFQTFSDTQFILGSSLTEPLRQIKDQSELEFIRRACRESDRALASLIGKGSYWIGKTESEFLAELSAEIGKGGINSFGGSVQAGSNSAMPHYTTGNAVIKKDSCLLCDFWGRYNGYFTDCTRTFYFGKPDEEFEKIYNIVLEAHLAAEAKALPGNTLGDVDFAARSVIEKHGFGEYFIHRTGHGLGIDVHEGDSVNKEVNTPIKPGMVFSIEPGIYLSENFGVRIENLVAIGDKGAEVLHAFPRELRVIE